MELARLKSPPNWGRCAILLRHANTTYPELKADEDEALRWFGHRPSTPDGLPIIGPSSASPDVCYTFGHGHVGLASAPVSARAAADLVGGKPPAVSVEPFSVGRFGYRYHDPRPWLN